MRATNRNFTEKPGATLRDFSRRTPFPGPAYEHVPRPSYAPSIRGTYRLDTPYRSYYDNRLPYQDNVRQDVQQSIERTPYNDENQFRSRTPYNPTPWNQRKLNSPRGSTQTPGFRASAIPGQREASGPLIKREDDSRRIPFRTRAYHANENETQHTPDNDYDTSYHAYEQGFYEGQNVAYWTQEATNEQMNEDQPLGADNDNKNDLVDDKIEHTDAHIASIKDITCRICHTFFLSNNKLHNHLKLSSCLNDSTTNSITPDLKPCKPYDETKSNTTGHKAQVVKSVAEGLKGDGYGFRGWHYATTKVKFTLSGPLHTICLDTGCSMSLIDRSFLTKEIPGAMIRRMASPISVRGIGSMNHNSNEYVVLDIYMPGMDERTAHIRREVHIVEELPAKMLVGSDIITPEAIIIDMSKKIAIIGSCKGIPVALSVTTRSNQRLYRPILAQKETVISPRSVVAVPITHHNDLPADRDFLFEPQYNGVTRRLQQTGAIYAHIVDCNMSHVQVHNASNNAFMIPASTKLGTLIEYDADGCYLVDSDARRTAGMAYDKGYGLKRYTAVPLVQASTPDSDTTPMETKLPNRVTVYGSTRDMEELVKVVNELPDLWKDKGQAIVPEKDWMSIPLIDNWAEKYKPGTAKVYPVGPKDKAIIDEDFDKLHQQGRMSWSNDPTPFSFPCFVIWKTNPDGTRKGRTVVDIRALNKISVPDAYPIPSQEKILASMRGATHISTIDAASFFYQWPVKPEHRHRLAVVSHRGQEIFNVAVMSYRNSLAYVQRRIDIILRPCRIFARAYVDDICIFSKSLQEHIVHLREVFRILNSYNIGLKPSKAFIGYPSVQLLGQRVDALGMTTAKEKLEAITALEFPKTLKGLETYLGMTGYLHHYIPFFAQIIEPLQDRKTSLNKSLRARKISTAGSAR